MDNEIINKYTIEKKSLAKIAKELNTNVDKVHRTLIKNNIPRRSLSNSHIVKEFNKNYFKRIDTEEKAYFLGFLYADGNVHRNIVQICLHPKDEEVLIKFKNALKSNHKIRNDRKYKRFSITSEDFANDLKNLGCIERKTFTLQFPNEGIVPKSLVKHFIRGYFDGDGCITYSEKSSLQWHFEIIGREDFVNKIQEELIKNGQLHKTQIIKEDKRKNLVYYLSYGGTSNITLLKLFDFLYKDATIFLKRKHAKFIEINNKILEKIENRKIK